MEEDLRPNYGPTVKESLEGALRHAEECNKILPASIVTDRLDSVIDLIKWALQRIG